MPSAPHGIPLLWPDSKAGPWLITVWWRAQHGSADPIGLEIRSWKDPDWDMETARFFSVLPDGQADVALPKIGSQFLKSLPIGELLRTTRGDLVGADSLEPPAGWEIEDWEEQRRESGAAELRVALEKGPRGGRDLGDDHYRLVARIYAEAVRSGRAPTAAVATHLTLSKSAAAKQVSRTRERGFLPPTTRGRVGKPSEEL